jgi:LmbE family N-acetylglucosaminyl deacetylase
MSRTEMAELRRAEQTAAAKVVGVTDLRVLAHPDGRVLPTLDLRRDISRVIRPVRPQRVIGMSPERSYERIYASHPDHLATGEATLAAVYPDSRNPFAHPELLEQEGLEPWTVEEVYLVAIAEPDTYVDTTEMIDRKLDALRCHVSQHPDPDSLEELLRGWGSMIARRAGFPEGHLAEGFRRVVTT